MKVAGPVVLQVEYISLGDFKPHTHFLLATGLAGNDDFTIVDPGHYNNSPATLSAFFSNYTVESANPSWTIRGNLQDPIDRSVLSVSLASSSPHPAFLVGDTAGNATGIDPISGRPFSQIANSFVFVQAAPLENFSNGPDDNTLVDVVDIYQPSPGTYSIQTGANDSQPFELDVTNIASDGTVQSQQAVAGQSPDGTAIEYKTSLDTSQGLSHLKAAPSFSMLASPVISYGTLSTAIFGHVGAGSLVPTGNVLITLNGVTHTAAIGASGNFSSNFDTGTLGASSVPYAITYQYAGDLNFTAAMDGQGSLVVNKVTPLFSLLSSPTIIVSTNSTTLSGKLSLGSLVPPGTAIITINAVRHLVGVNPDGTFSALINTSALGVGAYRISYSYDGDSNFTAATGASTLNVTYNVTALFDQSQPRQAGSTLPIQLALTDANGNDVSSSSTRITALGIASVLDPNDLLPADDPGNSYPDSQFKYSGGRYQYNLKMPKTLTPGTYLFYFMIDGDPIVHSVQFEVK
jgi:hypothetical protein